MNKDPLDELVDQLQGKIIEDIRENYSPLVIEHWQNPQNMGKLEGHNAHAKVTGQCGDTIEWFLKIEGDFIREVSFLTDGCGSSVACNSILTVMIKGKTLEEALQIEPEDLLKIIGKLPQSDRHCAYLAVETMREAIKKYWR